MKEGKKERKNEEDEGRNERKKWAEKKKRGTFRKTYILGV